MSDGPPKAQRFPFRRFEGDGFPPEGHWRMAQRPGRSGVPCVVLGCPRCGAAASLSESHMVTQDGMVNPSVHHQIRACGFHEWIYLQGWNGGVL